ncbi:MAG: hypothetical protein JJ896_16545 [Rhodothermales bacterium]|nr:hypothetical protein [Rhodothermales bacterium]MBO6781267.1 hypothetical protein [Rhodothermales bacterium]
MRSLQVERPSWDSLLVVLHFDEPARMTAVPQRPRFVQVTLFDAGYDTLYTGQDSVVFVPDGSLGPNEPVLVEACGVFETGQVCEQRAIHASPKRIQSDLEIDFPVDETMARGRYRLKPRIQRARFGTSDWENLDDPIPNRLEARVRVLETEDAGMTVPMEVGGGRFDLRRADGYRDFRFYLLSAFRQYGRAEVEFQLQTTYQNGPLTVASTVLTLSRKTEEEQVADVSALAEAAGERVLEQVTGGRSTRRAYVFVNDWEYDAGTGRYMAEVELHWRFSRRGDWYELVGRLEADDTGRNARYTFVKANNDADRRWRAEIDGRVIELGDLPMPARTPDNPDLTW